jgi:cephalosporin hydroxylase
MDRQYEIIASFRKLWQDRKVVFQSKFLGIWTLQNPLDVWITQEIASEICPDFIVETGTFHGGSAVLWSFLLEVINPAGRVLSIDVRDRVPAKVRAHELVKRRVEYVIGSSVDPRVISYVSEQVAGKKVMVILDSDHSEGHVFQELQAYAPMVSVGSYVIVQDTPAGPILAVHKFLEQDKRFEMDLTRERFMITNCMGGFLKRVR